MSVNGCEPVSRKNQAVPEPGRLTASETRCYVQDERYFAIEAHGCAARSVHVRSVTNIPVGEGLRSS